MLGGALSGTVGTQQGLAAAGGQAPTAGDGVFGPGVIGAQHCLPPLLLLLAGMCCCAGADHQ